MRATEQFGPVGIGWGYENGAPIFHETLVIVPVTVWHGDRSNTFGPVYGGAEWRSGNRVDSDAPKKAATDGLTKALSHLGFNADVFLGRFDDNKYVEELRREFAGGQGEERTVSPQQPITSEQVVRLQSLIKATSSNVDAFCKLLGVQKLPDITANRFDEALGLLETKLARMAKAATDAKAKTGAELADEIQY